MSSSSPGSFGFSGLPRVDERFGRSRCGGCLGRCPVVLSSFSSGAFAGRACSTQAFRSRLRYRFWRGPDDRTASAISAVVLRDLNYARASAV
jgi:hypothetical protein